MRLSRHTLRVILQGLAVMALLSPILVSHLLWEYETTNTMAGWHRGRYTVLVSSAYSRLDLVLAVSAPLPPGAASVYVMGRNMRPPFRLGAWSTFLLAPNGTSTLMPFGVPLSQTYSRSLGFYYNVHRLGYTGVIRQLQIPYWFLFAAATLVGVGPFGWDWWRRARRRRLIKSGRCVHCGYDLRGSTGLCPECGAERPAAPDAAAG